MEPAVTKLSKFNNNNSNKKRDNNRYNSIYTRSLLTRSLSLPITSIGKNIQETIEKNIRATYEGKCVVEGFIKPGSSKIITYSSGMVHATNIKFEVVFECYICCPVEGMLISCVAKNITKAGIRGESVDETPSPIVVFIMRDHHYTNAFFSSIEENMRFVARVVGQRYELNDKYVSIIAELVDTTKKDKEPAKPRIVFED